jgi:hypothetical protein
MSAIVAAFVFSTHSGIGTLGQKGCQSKKWRSEDQIRVNAIWGHGLREKQPQPKCLECAPNDPGKAKMGIPH